MQAYVLLSCTGGSEIKLISELKEIPEVTEINGIWGKYDVFLKISTPDSSKIDKIIQKLRTYPDVTDTYTMHVLYGQGGNIDND